MGVERVLFHTENRNIYIVYTELFGH